jgi:hypothetical protein
MHKRKLCEGKQDRNQSTYDQGQQHLNMILADKLELNTDHQDRSGKSYCGYDVGSDFHQGEDLLNNVHKKVGDCLILLDSQSIHSNFYAASWWKTLGMRLDPYE